MTASKIAEYSFLPRPAAAGRAWPRIAEAARPGLGVEACVARLKRYHYAFKRLHEILTARITAEPIYELKTGFSHHAYLCAEHVAGAARRASARCASRRWGWRPCRTRRWRSSSTRSSRRRRPASCWSGVYEKALPALDAALARHIGRHQPADRRPVGPRLPVRPARAGRHDRLRPQVRSRAWSTTTTRAAMAALAGAARRLPRRRRRARRDAPSRRAQPVERLHSATPYVYDPVPRRDERFQDLVEPGRQRRGVPLRPDVRRPSRRR